MECNTAFDGIVARRLYRYFHSPELRYAQPTDKGILQADAGRKAHSRRQSGSPLDGFQCHCGNRFCRKHQAQQKAGKRSIMALDRCIRNQGVQEESVYDSRDLLIL